MAEPSGDLGQSPQKPDMHIQSAVDKHIFVMCSLKIYGVPCSSCRICYPPPPPLLIQKILRICANLM